MDIIEDIGLEIIVLGIKKMKLEKQLNKCFTCTIRRLLSCLGFKKIENKIKLLEDKIKELKQMENLNKCSICKLTLV